MARRLHIKIIEASNLLNLDPDDQLNPYVLLRLKNQDKRNFEMTEVKNNTTNPIWNQKFNILAVDPNDVLLINLYNKGIKKDEEIMEELQFPVNMFQILAPIERKEIDMKLKKKKNFLPAGRLVFEIQAYPPVESDPRDPNQEVVTIVQTDGCKIHIKAFEAKDVIKINLGAKPDPYLRFKINDTVVNSKISTKTTNPIWNEELDIVSRDPSHDILEVDLVDNDLNRNQLMMNQITIPISEHKFGDHYVFDDYIKLKKKNAGKLHFELDFNKVAGKYVHAIPIQTETSKIEKESPIEENQEQELKAIEENPSKYEVLNEEPSKEEPQKEELVEEETIKEELVHEVPVKEEPEKEELEKEKAIIEEPEKEASANETSEKEQPVKQESIDEKTDAKEEKVAEQYVQTRDIKIEKKQAKLDDKQCKVIVKVVKCENLLKNNEKSIDPYVSIQIKDDSESLRKTKIIDNNNNPIWDDPIEFNIKNRQTDVILVNLYNGDEKIMDELSFPLKEWGIGTHIDYNQDIKLNNTDAGKIYLQFNVLKEGSDLENHDVPDGERTPFKIGESIKGTIVMAKGLPKTNSNGSDIYCVLSLYSPSEKEKKDKIKTGIDHNTQDPVWNKDFDFKKVQDGDCLRAEIFQTHKIVGDQCIAFAEIPIKGISENEKIEEKINLEKPAKAPKAVKKITDFGSITLSLVHNVQYH